MLCDCLESGYIYLCFIDAPPVLKSRDVHGRIGTTFTGADLIFNVQM